PLNVGVVVQNTGTAAAVYDAVVHGKPLIEKIVTVSGGAVKKPKNLLVPIGTQISNLLDYCETERDIIDKLIVGGPMMGMAQYTIDVPVIKGTSGVLALTKSETNPYKPKPCVNCGKCVDVCPMNLVPALYVRLGASSMWQEMKESNVMDCIECGCCAYICPANRPLTECIKLGKASLRKMINR
ncbi:MAG: 4Fe-4S dicluster domain-containing protein, partial [Fusobacteriaceae bacterium]